MLHELEQKEFERVLPLLRAYLRDPLMYATIEGRRGGRVFVDDPANPNLTLVWTNSECAYLAVGEGADRLDGALRRLILEQIIPAGKSAGRHFLSIFSFPNSNASDLEALFADQVPLRTAINTFSFNEALFGERCGELDSLPAGFTFKEIDREILGNPENELLTGDIMLHWGTIDDFLTRGSGHCILAGDEIVSWCYVQAHGGDSRTIDIWTAESHRRRGFGTALGAAFVEGCLSKGYVPFWICDEGNGASRRLAERLGFEYRGDLFLVDIPFYPFDFYRGLAAGFFLPAGEYRQAAESYEKAFTIQQAGAEDYHNAAIAWASAGDDDRALVNLQMAVARGWKDPVSLQNTEAFSRLRETHEWEDLF